MSDSSYAVINTDVPATQVQVTVSCKLAIVVMSYHLQLFIYFKINDYYVEINY